MAKIENAEPLVFSEGYFLNLDMTDKTGKEFLDGSIVKIWHDGREILAHVRYAFGRFEAVATFKDQRFIFGLNPAYEIVGHMVKDSELINQQAERVYAE